MITTEQTVSGHKVMECIDRFGTLVYVDDKLVKGTLAQVVEQLQRGDMPTLETNESAMSRVVGAVWGREP